MGTVALCTVAALLLRGDAVAWFLILSSATGQGVEFAGVDHGGRVFRTPQFRDAGRVDDRVLRNKRIDRSGGGRIGVRPYREFCACAAGGRCHAGGIGDGVHAGAEAGC